jgi:hypothetical protein
VRACSRSGTGSIGWRVAVAGPPDEAARGSGPPSGRYALNLPFDDREAAVLPTRSAVETGRLGLGGLLQALTTLSGTVTKRESGISRYFSGFLTIGWWVGRVSGLDRRSPQLEC